MSCPKCGYGGHNKVFHSGTGEVECENCRHDYVRNKKSKKEGSKSFELPLFDLGKDIRFSNDVWVAPNGKTSAFPIIDGKFAGLRSPILGDDSIVDHNFRTIGRIDGNGYFQPSWRI